MSPSQVHVISKQDLTKHESVSVDSSLLPALPEGSVRIRSDVIALSSNNMAYAMLGTLLGWWNTYPVPDILPAPYNDREQWGIVPAWGYGKVVESKDETIPKGTLLWGYWPTSSLPADFKFKPTAEAGYIREVSEHRKGLMTLYNFYEVVGDTPSKELLEWKPAVMAVWFAGYLLGQFGFAVPGSGDPTLNPAGQGDWTAEDADLSSAVVVSFAATSKTARGLAWNLSKRRSGENTPIALLEATRSPKSLPSLKADFETRATSYDDLSNQETIDWIVSHKPSRIVLVNCGAGAEIVRKFQDAILASDAPISKMAYITLVSMPGTAEHPDDRTSVVYMNTSPVIDNAFDALGIDTVAKARDAAFKEWVAEKAMGNLELTIGNKVEGDDGIEGAWKSLAAGNLPTKAMIFQLS